MIDIQELNTWTGNRYLWRYMSLHKFLSFIRSGAIHFSRMDKLEDVNEAISQRQLYEKYKNELSAFDANNNRRETGLEDRQRRYFVSCWFDSNRESMAMWSAYSDPDSLVIRVDKEGFLNHIQRGKFSTVTGLGPGGVTGAEKIDKLFLGKVHYKDFLDAGDRENFKEESQIIGFQKDIAYEHEQEFRFLIKQKYYVQDDSGEHVRDQSEYWFFQLIPEGLRDLEVEVVFHPRMEGWKQENIKQLLETYKPFRSSCRTSEIQLR